MEKTGWQHGFDEPAIDRIGDTSGHEERVCPVAETAHGSEQIQNSHPRKRGDHQLDHNEFKHKNLNRRRRKEARTLRDRRLRPVRGPMGCGIVGQLGDQASEIFVSSGKYQNRK